MKALLVAAAIAAAFTLPAKADDLESKIIDACAAYAPFSIAQRGQCINTITADNEQFFVDIETLAGKRIMADCEKMEVSERYGRYVELRMCFRQAYTQEKHAQILVQSIIGDIPEGTNSRRVSAEQCIEKVEQTSDYTSALACLEAKGDVITPSDVNMKRFAAAMSDRTE